MERYKKSDIKQFTPAAPGIYRFVIDQIDDKVSTKGNPMLKVHLSVAAFPDRDIQVHDHLVKTEAAQWKIDQFLASIGMDLVDSEGFVNFDETGQKYVGLTGEAFFDNETQPDGKKYLRVREYIAKSANNGPEDNVTAEASGDAKAFDPFA